ncbi:hypothetical protein RCC89_03835 [Cytophagaceae bacterium ABcell3]|nr:hypothetical protein RCC89_03835 [Cytophagaceae bacterium ABcell3]
MEIILKNYYDKNSLLSFDVKSGMSENVKLGTNVNTKGFYDIWGNIVFGIYSWQNEAFFFVNKNIISFKSIQEISFKEKEESISELIINLENGESIKLITEKDMESSSDLFYAEDESDLNLGILMSRLHNNKAFQEQFITYN